MVLKDQSVRFQLRLALATFVCAGFVSSTAEAGGVYVGGEVTYHSGDASTPTSSDQTVTSGSGSATLSLGTFSGAPDLLGPKLGAPSSPSSMMPTLGNHDSLNDPSGSRSTQIFGRGSPAGDDTNVLDPNSAHSTLDVYVDSGRNGSRQGADVSVTIPY